MMMMMMMMMLVNGKDRRVRNEKVSFKPSPRSGRGSTNKSSTITFININIITLACYLAMSNQYQAIPTSDETTPRESVSSDSQPRQSSRPRTVPPPPRDFNPPPPASWKRALLLAVIAFLFWFSLRLSNSKNAVKNKSIEEIFKEKIESKYGPDVVHAKRYSNEHKFRPAASPVITERTKDGRIRLRGANPAGVQ